MNRNIALTPTTGDDTAFIDRVSTLISNYASFLAAERVVVVQIDNWFDAKWLGFEGKRLGAIGVRSHMGGLLPSPPFVPNRVVSVMEYIQNDGERMEPRPAPLRPLHAEKSGGTVWYIRQSGLYLWYSGQSAINGRASVMVYHVMERDKSNGWYLGFERRQDWHVVRRVNISKEECEMIQTEPIVK